MNLMSILKVALPIAGSILLDENISPIKRENPYFPIVKNTIDVMGKVVASEDKQNIPIQYHGENKTLFETAKSMNYKYTF